MTPKKIYVYIHGVLGDDSPAYQRVKNLYRHFKFEKNVCQHVPDVGPQKKIVTPENIYNIALNNHRIAVRFIVETCGSFCWLHRKNSTRRIMT